MNVVNELNLSKVDQIQKCSINVSGWKSPLEIEYGIYNMGHVQYLLWKIVNVNYTFKIQLKLVYKHHDSKVEDHFKLTLIEFRKDYIEWMNEGFPEEWQKNYYNLFNNLMIKNNYY